MDVGLVEWEVAEDRSTILRIEDTLAVLRTLREDAVLCLGDLENNELRPFILSPLFCPKCNASRSCEAR